MSNLPETEIALLLEKLQGAHTVTTQVEYPVSINFQLAPSVPSIETMMRVIENQPLIVFMRLQVSAGNTSYLSKEKLPIFVAHGARLGQEHQVDIGKGLFIKSEEAVEAVSDWLRKQSLPPVKVLISCDKPHETQAQFQHWVNDPSSGVIGLEGDAFWGEIVNETFVLPLDDLRAHGIRLTSPFSDEQHPSRWIVNALFDRRSGVGIVLKERLKKPPIEVSLRRR